MKFRYFLTLFLLFCVIQNIVAQRLITGKVQELYTKEKLDSVDVAIYKGTAVTTTNKFGYFQLHVQEGDSLLLTHPDYETGFVSVPHTDVFTVFMKSVDDSPVYLEGEAELYEFLHINLTYPTSALLKNVEGLVAIQITIDSTGRMIACKSLNELKGKCTKEALRVFEQIPGKWSPGYESKNLIFPVIFKLKETKKEDLEVPQIEYIEGKIMQPVLVTY